MDSNYKHFVVERYTRFLLLTSDYWGSERKWTAYLALFRSLIFRGHLREAANARFVISDFSRMLPISKEEFAVKRLTCSNVMAERGHMRRKEIPSYSFARWKEVKAEMMSDFASTITELSNEENGEELLRSLGLNLQGALQLCILAIKEGQFVGAITDLAMGFDKGGKGVVKDVLRAAKLYEKSIEQYRVISQLHV